MNHFCSWIFTYVWKYLIYVGDSCRDNPTVNVMLSLRILLATMKHFIQLSSKGCFGYEVIQQKYHTSHPKLWCFVPAICVQNWMILLSNFVKVVRGRVAYSNSSLHDQHFTAWCFVLVDQIATTYVASTVSTQTVSGYYIWRSCLWLTYVIHTCMYMCWIYVFERCILYVRRLSRYENPCTRTIGSPSWE